MIKIANNLENLVKHSTHTKQALIGTTVSALIHGAAADDDEPLFREILRGGAKGLGADLGLLLGGITGLGLGGYTGYNLSESDDKAKAKGTGAGVGLGGLLGAGIGGTGGYLLVDKLINTIDKKKQKNTRTID
jgi:hypothetical protein